MGTWYVEALETQRPGLDASHNGCALHAGGLGFACVINPWPTRAGGGEGGRECAGTVERVS